MDVDQKDPHDIDFMTVNSARTFPILASSPNSDRYRHWRKHRVTVPVEYMPLWTRDELCRG